MYDHINISLQKWVGEDDEDDVFEDIIISPYSTSYEFSGDLLEPGQQYTFYVEFVDVTEAFNPEGLRRSSQTDDEPILFTYASSITALDMEIVGDRSGALDGIVIYIESEDPVKETLIFENGALTSIFDEDNGQNIHKNEGLSYQYYEINDDQFSITMEGGEHYIFYENNGTGRLLDYSNNGELDESGTWDFTFIIHDWEEYDDFSANELDFNKWDSWWWPGANAPRIAEGALELSGSGNLNDSGSQTTPEIFSHLDLGDASKHSIALLTDSNVYGLEAEFMLPSGTQYETGLNFLCFDIPADGNKSNIKQFGPELEYWEGEGLVLEFGYTDPFTGEDIEISRPAQFDTYYKMSLIHTGSTNSMYLNE